MKNLKVNCLVIVVIMLSCLSCRKDFFTKPGLAPSSFTATFPFELVDGLMVIEVEIRDQVFNFVVDSGALTVVSKKVAEQLGFKAKFSRKFGGSQKGNTKIGFFTLDKLIIAGVDFDKLGVGIMDFTPINNTGCYNFQGIIGPNLMRSAVWEIDYQQQLITITSNDKDLILPANFERLDFKTNGLFQPTTIVEIAGQTETVTMDLGSSGGIKLSKKLLDKINTQNTITSLNSGYGNYTRAISGYGEPLTTHFANAKQVSIGDVNFSDELVVFKQNGVSTIGNQFFKNYRVILSWFNKEMILIPQGTKREQFLHNFGFNPIYKAEKPYVGFIYKNSSADKAGLKATDQIVAINNIDLHSISKEDWCGFEEQLESPTQQEVSISVIRNGQVLDFQLLQGKVFGW